MLAEHGFPGLALFLLILAALFFNGLHIAKVCKPYPELGWAGDLGRKLSLSITLYAACGALLSLAFHPILYDFFALSIALRHLVHRRIDAIAHQPGYVAAGEAGPTGGAHAQKTTSLSWVERRKLKQLKKA